MSLAGFDIVYMEEYSIVEQMRIMKDAEFIVSPHGAGLTNMIFARSGAKILELIPSRYLTPMFRQLAVNCGHEYGVLIGDTRSSESSKNHEFQWSIDVEKLDRVLSEADMSSDPEYRRVAAS